MKILVITNLYPPQILGGYERSIADFARLFQHRGHAVLVLTSDTPEFSASHPSQYAEPAIERCFSLLGQWTSQGPQWRDGELLDAIVSQNQAVLAQHLQAYCPDVCLAGNLDFLQYSAEILEQLLAAKVPVAHYLMNDKPNYDAQQTPQQSAFRLITCSDWVKGNLQAAGYLTKTTQTIYPGAEVEAFYRSELPERDRLRIAYASMVAPYKGADVLIEALSMLQEMGIEFTATIAGGSLQPDFVEALKQFVELEGMQTVQFVGALSRPELIKLYQTHNVLVFPSRFEEPFGISQIEAMAAGLTLVTSGTGGAQEVVAEPGNDGLLFESENPFELAEVLSSLVNDPAKWGAIAQAGQQRALSAFSQTNATEQLEAVLLDLINTCLQGERSH
jgi:glycosyltransferase involved in cell wall biosynthesis